ncbi:MAG: hypothetical protein KJ578_07575 [Bacteroidetes bacterium]|nr:hypothetical protein [Bacteroidota bacterium]MBU1579721.1 hypothetical protein [Bacteroidota bacterium]MBU2465782.1 hypothetical protein [Bacteroidota bacterium]MBU2557622.1 hypothetical protein [Bacteroidota bacterium]MDA3944361.1 hypothetical protein [Bacteroidota bacterium]
MKKLALALSFFAFFAFGTATFQTAIAADNGIVIVQGDETKKKDKKTKKTECADKKTSCCKSEMKKEACNDDKKVEKK